MVGTIGVGEISLTSECSAPYNRTENQEQAEKPHRKAKYEKHRQLKGRILLVSRIEVWTRQNRMNVVPRMYDAADYPDQENHNDRFLTHSLTPGMDAQGAMPNSRIAPTAIALQAAVRCSISQYSSG